MLKRAVITRILAALALLGGMATAAPAQSEYQIQPGDVLTIEAIARLAAQGRQQIEETIDTYIMGEVNAPGLKQVKPDTTILQLLAAAGGITPFAADRRIELRRTDPDSGEVTTYLFSYDGKANGPRIRGGTTLVEGDVVVVPTRGLFE